LVVKALIVGGSEHPERAVAASAVVKDLHVLEDRVGELEASIIALTLL